MITAESLIAVYIVASGRNGTLYVGVTSELVNRVQQHKSGRLAGFSRRYGCKRLVWFESHTSMIEAIRREKWLKHLPRAAKLKMIERQNPEWRDLSDGWFNETTWDFDGAYEANLRAP